MNIVLALALLAAQDKPPVPKDEELTPEKAIQLLKETEGLMAEAEALLNDSARGRALGSEKGAVDRLNDILKNDPAAAQKTVLEKIEKLLGKSQDGQKGAVERIEEVIRKAKT